MNDQEAAIQGLAMLIRLIGGEQWSSNERPALDQAHDYMRGIRDGRIADVTFQAVTVARMIASAKEK